MLGAKASHHSLWRYYSLRLRYTYCAGAARQGVACSGRRVRQGAHSGAGGRRADRAPRQLTVGARHNQAINGGGSGPQGGHGREVALKALSRTLKVSGQRRGRHSKKKYQSKTGAWPHISQISLPAPWPARPVHALLSASWRLVCGIFCCVRVLTSSRLSNMLPCSVHDPGEEYTNEQQTLHTTKVLHLHGIYTRLYARHPRAPHATPQNMVIPPLKLPTRK